MNSYKKIYEEYKTQKYTRSMEDDVWAFAKGFFVGAIVAYAVGR